MSRFRCERARAAPAWWTFWWVVACTAWHIHGAADAAEPVRFNRDIRPILSSRCFACHGRDENHRKSGLRLDVRDNALNAAESKAIPITPGKPESSELIRRIFSTDRDEMMPPADSGKNLTAAEKELLKQWVSEGAEYEPHWSLVPPMRVQPPIVKQTQWPRNPVDNFVLVRLEREGLRPSPAAEPATLLRRLCLDLTGLPPAAHDVSAFQRELAAADIADAKAGDRNQRAAERVYASWVDKLLASPHYGERMAVDWLDAARFADSNGYQVDRDREMYAWRDWVIAAFNANQPFDQFTIEQLAGDLLPNATLEQKIATGFHRNHMLNEEGGIIAEEFLAEYCSDRVETTAAVWLGQTFTCTRCHDHKFDPFTQRDYYGLYSFFHNVPEGGIGNYGANIRRNAPPMLKLPSPEIEAKIASLNRELDEVKKSLAALQDAKNPEHVRLTERVAALNKQIDEIDLQIPTTLVMQELPAARVTRILMRGEYNKLGDEVTANTPAALPGMSPDSPKNRLGLARWIVDLRNPLTARVTVNRLWQSLYGVGLVRTAEDFGTQGEPPSHPELLDWLATEFVRTGWDVKAMLRLMVTSSTYRQSARSNPSLLQRDPENRLLARGPRFRLQAEFLRDQALAVSGLLSSKLGGPSVRPYHPPGLYEQVVAGSSANTYVVGTGDELYRRSLYTYWKRSVPNPAMLTFDAPFRETCVLRRPRTNTPLQALNVMNDPTYVEAARFLAQRMVREAGNTAAERVRHGFQLTLARSPSAAEQAILVAAFERARKDFENDPTAVAELLKVGESPSDTVIEPVELATLATVAMTILNLDETLTKE
ncbi:MAG: PSD1 and planctomycete cytochrome C domain-containing protein [Planctomycetaceae bacterium]